MSDLDNAINSINASAAKAENTATFLDDMSTFDEQSSVTNPNNGQTVASIPKQVKDRTDELFAAAESDINQAVSDAAQSATDAQDAADSIGRYQGLWPDTGGSADKGDTYQTQISGTPTGQYFTALQNTTVEPVGDDANWREVVSNQSLGTVTNYTANSISDMVMGITLGGVTLDFTAGDVIEVLGRDSADDGYARKFIVKASASGGVQLNNGKYAVLINDAPKERWDSDNSKSNDVDVFVAYGQSNARGSTPIASSTPFVLPTGWGLKWNWQTSTLDDLQDPCAKDGGSDISAWPSFADQWTRLTGRKCIIVNAAVGGSTIFKLNPTAPEGWFDDMTNATDSAIAAAIAEGYRIKSVQMLWAQGEADAKNQTDIATYKSLMDDIESAFTAKYFGQGYTYGGVYISKVGFDWSSQIAADYDWTLQIGFTQTSATKYKKYQTPAFDGAPTFTRTNRLMSNDDIHYSHLGYNLMGEVMAENIWRTRYKGDDVKGKIIGNALSYKDVQFVEPIQSNSGVESPISCIFKIKEYALDEGAPLAEVYGNLIRFLRGELVNAGGFGIKWDFDATTGNRLKIQNGDGTIQMKFLNGGIQIQNSSGVAQHTLYPDGRVQFHNLPDSPSGLATGELYYDPADGNTVKYK
ncbi:coil containing protein [Vibrio phage 1.105.O._10N.286.49.B4]|nr:coil containing protein [Vibrio phage 1.105.O._10N.286.49.B4]